MEDTTEPALIYCGVTVSCEGMATAKYRFQGNQADGAQEFEGDVSTWSDSEIAALFRDLLQLSEEDAKKVTVNWE